MQKVVVHFQKSPNDVDRKQGGSVSIAQRAPNSKSPCRYVSYIPKNLGTRFLIPKKLGSKEKDLSENDSFFLVEI